MLYNVVAEIEIDGTETGNYYSILIRQHFNEHHEFQVKYSHDIIDAKTRFALKKLKDFIGKIIIIRLIQGSQKKVLNEFKGIITEVGIEQFEAHESQIVIKGYSPTIALESGSSVNSFLEKDLKKIVTEVTSAAVSDCKVNISPANTAQIKYLTQYKESHFEFLNRLSAEYGEWFFFNGKEIFFGKPSTSKEIELVSGEDIISLQLGLQVLPMDSQSISYFDPKNDIVKGKTPGSVDRLGEFGSFAVKESGKIFNAVASIGDRPKAENTNEIGKALTVQKSAIASQLEFITGTSINPEVVLGATASISVSELAGGAFTKQEQGKFLIVGVTHQISEDGNYRNDFEALPASITVIPVGNVRRPFAETQVAQVVDNKDPDKLGRVKVKMLWQDKTGTDWIRILTPDGGPGGKTGKNRGFVFIPEVDDQVLVGFSFNDPDWPFVMGSIFHGKSAAGGGEKNSIKTLGTNSGHLITFNDDDKSIKIEDAKGNIINFDGKGKIIMKSSDSIELTCGQSSLSLAKDGTISVKGVKIAIEGTSELNMKALNVTAKADVGLKLEGATVGAKGSATVSVEGAMAKLAGSAMTEITGAIVKIN